MDQAAEGNFVTENPEIAPGSSSEGITEVMVSIENVVYIVPDIQAVEDNFVIENPEIVPGSSSEEVTEDMDSIENVVYVVPDIQGAEDNFVIENPERVPGSSSEDVTEVMDSIENLVYVVPDIQAAEVNFVIENPEIVPGSSSEEVTEVMDSIENLVYVMPDIQAAEDSFVIENPERVPGSSSEEVTEVMDSTENVVDVVPDIPSKYMKNKSGYAKSKIQNNTTKEMTVASVPERKSLKRKAAHPPTSDMVIDSITALRKRNGVSFEDIRKYMEEKYAVNMKRLKYHADKFLQKSVDNGVLEKIDRGGVEERFKIKKSENIKKVSKNLPRKAGKVKPEQKKAATKKQVRK